MSSSNDAPSEASLSARYCATRFPSFFPFTQQSRAFFEIFAEPGHQHSDIHISQTKLCKTFEETSSYFAFLVSAWSHEALLLVSGKIPIPLPVDVKRDQNLTSGRHPHVPSHDLLGGC